jgi:hypothetical protein
LLSRDEIEGFGVKALGGLDVKMDGVIVTVVHDEFREMGLETFRAGKSGFCL